MYISAILQSYYLPEIDDDNELKKLSRLTFAQLNETLIELKPKLHNVTDLKSKDQSYKSNIELKRTREKVNPSSNLTGNH